MKNSFNLQYKDFDRRQFLSAIGKSTGLMALASTSVAALFKDVEAATERIAHLSPDQVASDEDFWFEIQQAFTVTRGSLI